MPLEVLNLAAMGIPAIPLDRIDYELPAERIADRPLDVRSEAKLLRLTEAGIEDRAVSELPSLIAENSSIFLNKSKVVNARLFFPLPKTSGLDERPIEVFCLSGASGEPLHQLLSQKSPLKLEAMVGGVKRWNARAPGLPLFWSIKNDQGAIEAKVRRIDNSREFPIVELTWKSEHSPELSFGELLERAGHVPLPPYMKRADRIEDRERYQTVYAKSSGSVAAPTAGLHLDARLMSEFEQSGHRVEELILHVGAGTFLPIKSERSDGHTMHQEWIDLPLQSIKTLRDTPFEQTLAVGTTALRTLESLYWFGVRELIDPAKKGALEQAFPYDCPINPSKREALDALIHRMEMEGVDRFSAPTGLFLLPGVKFYCAGQLLTNFHQPKSSLLFLVEAYIGERWKQVYQHALNSDYRFLSYGDACLFTSKLAP